MYYMHWLVDLAVHIPKNMDRLSLWFPALFNFQEIHLTKLFSVCTVIIIIIIMTWNFMYYELQMKTISMLKFSGLSFFFLTIEHLWRPSILKSVHTLNFNYSTLFFLLQFNFTNCSRKNGVFNFQYSPQTQSVWGVYSITALKLESWLALHF